MSNIARATVFVIAGFCWFAAALFFAALVLAYLADGAGLQFFALSFSSGSVLLGLIHVVGFATGAVLCFAIGIGFCAHGLIPPVRGKSAPTHSAVAIHPARDHGSPTDRIGGAPFCVRCGAHLSACVEICGECGWTQPHDDAA